MTDIRKKLIILLRALGVIGLCLVLGWAFLSLETGGDVEKAAFTFVGTADDADCAILQSREYTVIIDTGEEQDAAHILEVLREKRVERIDCMILTHPDKDHIGGANAILDALPVELAVIPYYSKDKEKYRLLLEKINEEQIDCLTLSRARTFVFGDLELKVFPPEDFYYEKDNDYSLAALAEHGNVRLYFAGDAQKQRLKELLQDEIGHVDLYKVAYHGRSSGKNADLIGALTPDYAVVTAADADEEIKEALGRAGSEIFYTVGNDVELESDGKRLKVTPADKLTGGGER